MKKAVSYRLSEEAIKLLKTLAGQSGLSQASVLELLIRSASKDGVQIELSKAQRAMLEAAGVEIVSKRKGED